MDSFSWADSLRATLGPCLQCFGHHPVEGHEQDNGDTENTRPNRILNDELEGLLGDVEHSDVEAETMSLHSNVGEGNGKKRRKKRRQRRSIRLFGYDLFGRPPIQLSDSEDEEDRLLRTRRRGSGGLSATNSSSSISAFDSDASPLDTDAIARMASEEALEQARRREEAEAAERAKREERRRKRRAKKESRHLSVSDALSLGTEGTEFEGFQGSGYGGPSPSPQLHDTGSDRASTSSPSHNSLILTQARIHTPGVRYQDSQEDYGGFVQAQNNTDFQGDRREEEADFDGAVYATSKRSNNTKGSDSSRSHTRSQSLSQTSGSRSLDTDRASYSYYSHYVSSQNSHGAPPFSPSQPPPYSPGGAQHPHFTATLTHSHPSMIQPLDQVLGAPQQKKRKKKKNPLKSTTPKRSNSSPTSQSPSLPSLDSQAPFDHVEPAIAPPSKVAVPPSFTSDSFEGFPADVGASTFSHSRFPSVGFGVSRGKGLNRVSSAANGAFLARRGDD